MFNYTSALSVELDLESKRTSRFKWGAFSACSESGTEWWAIVRNRSDGLTTIIQFLDLPLEIAACTFKHRAVSGIVAAFELLNHVLQRQLEALFLAQSIRRFPCQARLFGH